MTSLSARLPEQLRRESQSASCTGCIGRSLNLCGSLTDAQLPELVALGGRRQWRRRDILFRAGDPITNFFKITRGLVAVSRTLDDGRRQIVALRIAGDCVGFLHTDGRYTFEGHAITDVEACAFSRRRFDELAQRYPALAAATADALVRAQREAGELVLAMGQLRSTERVAYFLAKMHALYASRFGDTATVDLDMNRGEIGDYLGLTIETVSRSIAKLKKRGLISLPHGNEVVIENIDGLRELGNFGP